MNYDVVIFGSGFAAYELARTLTQAAKSVMVIERGTRDFSSADPHLSRVPFRREPIKSGGVDFGANVAPSFDHVPRYIGLGGTSVLWSGKWRPLDALDFQRRSSLRQWPLSPADLAIHCDVVARSYGFPDWSEHDQALAYHERVACSHGLRLIRLFEQHPPVRLPDKWVDIERTGRATIVCEAAAEALPSNSGCIGAVRVRAAEQEFVVEAQQFIVACGGVESVCMSHRLRTQMRPQPTASAHYGGFMDHPKTRLGEIAVKHNRELVDFLRRAQYQSRLLLAFSLPEDELAREGIGNHTVFLWPSSGPGLPDWCGVTISLEQFPEEQNAVIVGSDPCVTWRMSGSTWRDLGAFLQRFVPRLGRLVGPLSLKRRLEFSGASHHLGALPMGRPGQGAVDVNCRFHDVENLYCVSSAVFPFAGSANPTMAVVALAHRLASHLEARVPWH
jgi:choline dehydrogenase-like flavoprotein